LKKKPEKWPKRDKNDEKPDEAPKGIDSSNKIPHSLTIQSDYDDTN